MDLQKSSINMIDYIISIDDSYTNDVKRFVSWLDLNGKATFTIEDIEQYYTSLVERNLSANTINKYLFAVKKRVRDFFESSPNLTVGQRYDMNRNLKKIKKQKINSKAIDNDKIPTPDELDRLMGNVTEKLQLFICFLKDTGCRVSEMTGIKHTDIKNMNGYHEITITGKGKKIRKIKVSSELIERIKTHNIGSIYLFETSGGKRYQSDYISHQIEKNSTKYLGKTFSSHSLRHYFATTMIKKTGNIKGVSKYLGHSTTAITLDMYHHQELTFKELSIMI
jgi:integrase/recombinase XerD